MPKLNSKDLDKMIDAAFATSRQPKPLNLDGLRSAIRRNGGRIPRVLPQPRLKQ